MKQEGDSHHHRSSVVCSSVIDLQYCWVIRCCSVDDDSDHGDNFQWQYKLTNKSKVVESAPFGVTASGFLISVGTPFIPVFQALPVAKREHGVANLYLAFKGYNGVIPQSPVASWGYLVTGQIFRQ